MFHLCTVRLFVCRNEIAGTFFNFRWFDEVAGGWNVNEHVQVQDILQSMAISEKDGFECVSCLRVSWQVLDIAVIFSGRESVHPRHINDTGGQKCSPLVVVLTETAHGAPSATLRFSCAFCTPTRCKYANACRSIASTFSQTSDILLTIRWTKCKGPFKVNVSSFKLYVHQNG